jgi:hypothetical protein
MDCLEEFLDRLLLQGRILFRSRPTTLASQGAAIDLLRRVYDDYRLDVAGPLIPFDARVALEASELVMQASWALVDQSDAIDVLRRRLSMTQAPGLPSHHLSADLVLRFLPQIHRRARVRSPSDPFAMVLEKVLRQWPLSGVLAGLAEGPTTPLDFGGHEGLMLLYAERWMRNEAPAWRPEGRTLEYAELVGAATGRDWPKPRSGRDDDD